MLTASGSSILPMATTPPRLEDTLITGYRQLASRAHRRRIDVELRLLDVALALVLGVVTLPLTALIALAILVTDGRPVLYRGARVGRAGRFFTINKFRTLRVGAEERIGQYLGPELVAVTAAEYTRIGR